MADTEEYFPRGGKKPSVLFKKSANFLGAPEKTEKKKKKPKRKAEGDDGYLSDEETRGFDESARNCAIGLSYKTIKQGVLVLGRVRQIHETRVIVMLPCRLIGNVMACHVSEPYNKVLEAYVHDKTENVRELSQMFRRGQYIAVKVLEAQGQSLMLSTMPQHVNGAKQHADMVKGALFQAAVSSMEDHGYVMDIGIPNTRAFLPKSEMNPELELDVGMVTWCAVKSVSTSSGNSIVTLSTTPDYVQGGVLRRKQTTPLLPGTTVEFIVDTPLDNGIEGTIFGDTKCYIQRQHVDKVKGKKPALGQKIRARVLYVLPTRNCPFLTMKNIFESTYPDLETEQKYKDGDIIDDAQVLKIFGRSVHFRLGRGSSGALSIRRLLVDEDLDDEDIVAKSYPVGSTHKVRVLCYNLSDYVYSVTDQPEVVSEKYFSLEQLAAGDLVPATVKSVSEKMVELSVGRVRGFVPQTHLAETGIFVDPNKVRASNLSQKKYKVGQSVTARVLAIDPVKQSLTLTLKPSLLHPDLIVLKSYEEAEVGKAYVGVVRLIRDYLLVAFFNNVTAYIPRWFTFQTADESLSQFYHLGQMISCTIVNVKPEEKKMTGSLITPPFTPDENWDKRKINKRKQKPEDSDGIPHKKHKTEDETETKPKKKNKQENEDNAEESVTPKKKKKSKHQEEETADETKTKTKKKKKQDTESQENIDAGNSEKDNKKKKKKVEEIVDEKETKPKKKKTQDTESQENIDAEKDSIKKKKKHSISEEESDAIETDMYDDEEEILTPHEQGLVDLSDCSTFKEYKKRVIAILKAIDSRSRRVHAINAKIANIEEIGLTKQNKKYHTAMQTEKIVIQERTQKLLDILNIAQDKVSEIEYVKNNDYKEEQKKRKKEKKEAAKQKKLEKVKEKSVKKNEEEVKKGKIMEIKVVESLEPALDVPSAKDFWSANADNLSKTLEEEESSSSEDESKDQPKKKRKKLTVAEKLCKAREEENRVRAMEQAAIDSEAQPRSVEQFERSVLAHPDCSQLWIAYMAFHLQATELEKARAVARKALNTISFREEQEKLNVWLALINLEQRFGTKESQQKTLEDALQLNDPYKVHASLLDIFTDTGKHQELSSLVDLMMRKYKKDPNMYIQAGGACFKLGLVDKARQVMQKAIAVLEKKEHVNVLVQFALLERASGGRERAEALFEQVLAVYPQRVDVCAVYVDTLMKTGDIDQVRQVMERMTSQKLPARKMKILYKKWIEIEEKCGDETQVESIRQRAMEFIEKAKF